MRFLNISFLQKTPVWVFFCFCAVCLLCVPVESHAQSVVNVSTDWNVIKQTMNDFQNATRQWQTTFIKYAEYLFWTLAPISLVWRFGQIAMQGGGIQDGLAEFVRFLIFIGFYDWLLENGAQIAEDIVNSIEDMASKAAGLPQTGIDPSWVLNLGLNTFEQVLNVCGNKFSSWNVGTDINLLFTLLACLLFLCICALTAINLLLAIISVWFLMYAGIFILGFGATSWTSEMAIGYFRTVFSASMRIAGMMLIVGVCGSIIENITNRITPDITSNLLSVAELIISAFMMYLLSEKVPDQLASLTSGSLGSNHAQISHADSGIKGGAMAAGQLAGQAALATAGAAGTVAMQAIQRSIQKAREMAGVDSAGSSGSSGSSGGASSNDDNFASFMGMKGDSSGGGGSGLSGPSATGFDGFDFNKSSGSTSSQGFNNAGAAGAESQSSSTMSSNSTTSSAASSSSGNGDSGPYPDGGGSSAGTQAENYPEEDEEIVRKFGPPSPSRYIHPIDFDNIKYPNPDIPPPKWRD